MTVKTPYTERTVVVTPLVDLFKSRRFIVTLAGVIAAIVIALVPGLGTLRTPIITLITVAVAVIVGGYSISDAATAGQGAATETSEDPKQALKDAVNEVLIELLPDALEQPAITLSDELIDQIAVAVAAKIPPPIINNAPVINTPPVAAAVVPPGTGGASNS